MDDKQQEDLIIPSKLERLLLTESDRAQKATEMYAREISSKIADLEAKIRVLTNERDAVVTEGNRQYNDAIKEILATYRIQKAEIDFNTPEGPIIKVIELAPEEPEA